MTPRPPPPPTAGERRDEVLPPISPRKTPRGSGCSSSPRPPPRHKPLTWRVVPTSLTLPNGLYSYDAGEQMTGVTLTGMRDSMLSEAVPRMAQLAKPAPPVRIVALSDIVHNQHGQPGPHHIS